MIAWEWGQNKRQLNNWLKVPITIVPIEFKFKYKQYVHRVNFLICICRVLDDDDFSIEFVSTEKCGRTFWFLSSKRDDGGKLSSYKISTYSSSFSSFHSVLLLLLLYLSLSHFHYQSYIILATFPSYALLLLAVPPWWRCSVLSIPHSLTLRHTGNKRTHHSSTGKPLLSLNFFLVAVTALNIHSPSDKLVERPTQTHDV